MVMTDINDVMPKIPNMRWGALMNRPPTDRRIREMNRLFPHNGRWHTVFEDADKVYVDEKLIWKKDPKSWA